MCIYIYMYVCVYIYVHISVVNIQSGEVAPFRFFQTRRFVWSGFLYLGSRHTFQNRPGWLHAGWVWAPGDAGWSCSCVFRWRMRSENNLTRGGILCFDRSIHLICSSRKVRLLLEPWWGFQCGLLFNRMQFPVSATESVDLSMVWAVYIKCVAVINSAFRQSSSMLEGLELYQQDIKWIKQVGLERLSSVFGKSPQAPRAHFQVPWAAQVHPWGTMQHGFAYGHILSF